MPTIRTLVLVLMLAAPLAAPLTASVDPALAPAIGQFQSGQFAQAQGAFATYVAAHPNDADGHYWNGRALIGLRRVDAGVAALETAVKLAPGRSDVVLALGRGYARSAQDANVFRMPGLAKRARECWDKAVALDPDNLDARESLVDFHVMAPGLLGGSVDEAAKQAEEIARRDAARGAIARATVAQSAKDLARAEKLLRDALGADAGEDRVRRALGLLLQAEQKWEDAFALYDTILVARPDAWDALYQVGRTAALSGRKLERGAQALARYLGHTPGPEEPAAANAHYRLGMIREQQSDKAAARSEYQAALKLDPALKEAKAALEKLS